MKNTLCGKLSRTSISHILKDLHARSDRLHLSFSRLIFKSALSHFDAKCTCASRQCKREEKKQKNSKTTYKNKKIFVKVTHRLTEIYER